MLDWLKRWDLVASSRVDHYIANSKNVRDQIKKFYNRESEVIYPFADLDFFKVAKVPNWQLKRQNYYLVVSRLVKWKKIDIAINACQKLGANLKIVGTGPDETRLKGLTINDKQSTINFVGKVTPERLRDLYQNAKALIVTQEEDFGISTVEAQACGLSVIAYAKGGQSEIIKNGKTGVLYDLQTIKSLSDAIVASTKVKWSLLACRKNSLKYSKANFVGKIENIVKNYATSSQRS